MSKVKDWIIDIESYTWEAINDDLSLKETISFVKRKMKNVDESYVRRIYEEYANG